MNNLALEVAHISFLAKHWGYHFADTWAAHWLENHQRRGGELVKATVKKLAKSRTGEHTRDLAIHWTESMETLFQRFQIVPHAIIPYDETRLGFRHGDKLAISRITSADRKFKFVSPSFFSFRCIFLKMFLLAPIFLSSEAEPFAHY